MVDSSEKSESGRRQTKDAGFSNTGFTQWILKSIQQDPHQEEAVLPTKEMALAPPHVSNITPT